jgi:hypothetical protein
MNNINFVFYHPHLSQISDRTLRSLLKKISAIAREIQSHEVLFLINTSDASPSEKQSMRDRLNGPLKHIPAYYLQNLERGSIELTITLTAVGIWLLQQTIGESIKESWLKSKMHKMLVNYLSGDLRRKVVDRHIDGILDGWIFDRYLIEDINKFIDDCGDITIRVELSTPDEIQSRIKEADGMKTIENIIKESERLIMKIENMDDA